MDMFFIVSDQCRYELFKYFIYTNVKTVYALPNFLNRFWIHR